MSAVDAKQESLPLMVIRDMEESLSENDLAKIPDFHSSIKKCVDNSGRDDKFVSLELGIDAAQWSRIKSGQANFPDKKLPQLMAISGNRIPLRWLAQNEGFGLVRLKSAVEAELEAERAKVKDMETRMKHMEEFFKMAQK